MFLELLTVVSLALVSTMNVISEIQLTSSEFVHFMTHACMNTTVVGMTLLKFTVQQALIIHGRIFNNLNMGGVSRSFYNDIL